MARTEIITVLPEGANDADVETVLAEIEAAAPGAEIRYTRDGRNWQSSRAGVSTPIPMGGSADAAADDRGGKSKR